jgi:hypothetical protein
VDAEHPAAGPINGRSLADPALVERYEIRVAGRLDGRWSSWFDGLVLTPQADGTTVIAGPVRDQAALHGALQRLRDLGLTLLSLSRTTTPPDPNPTDHPGAPS